MYKSYVQPLCVELMTLAKSNQIYCKYGTPKTVAKKGVSKIALNDWKKGKIGTFCEFELNTIFD